MSYKILNLEIPIIQQQKIDMDKFNIFVEELRPHSIDGYVPFEIMYNRIQKVFYELNILEMKFLIDYVEKLIDATKEENYVYLKYDLMTKYVDRRWTYIKSNKWNELKIRDAIVDQFDNLFGDYEFIAKEHFLNGEGRIDILAQDKESQRTIIIEVKKKDNDPNSQLLRYARHFNNPILIAVIEELPKRMLSNIQYYKLNYTAS
jgi:hypothetical protein